MDVKAKNLSFKIICHTLNYDFLMPEPVEQMILFCLLGKLIYFQTLYQFQLWNRPVTVTPTKDQ